MNVKIFTKENCSYCVKAKLLLKSKGIIDYIERPINVESDSDIESVKKELGIDSFKTVPQISIDGKYIGGYNELEQFFKNN